MVAQERVMVNEGAECVIALPSSIRPVTAVRSTLIQSSLTTLKEHGYFERYLAELNTRHRDTILQSLAPEWLPLDVAVAHYGACDALRLSNDQLLSVGESVGNRIQGTFIATLLKRARSIGLTPWVPFGQFDRLWQRLMQGGAVALYKKGPKDASIDVRNLPLARFTYFRAAFCGVIASGAKLGAGRAVSVRISDAREVETRLVFTVSWV